MIITSGNKNDLQKIDDVVKNSVKFITAETLETVFENALETRNAKK